MYVPTVQKHFLVVEHFPLFLGVQFPLSTLFEFLQKFATHQHGINFVVKKLQREILISDPKSRSVSEEFSMYEFPVNNIGQSIQLGENVVPKE